MPFITFIYRIGKNPKTYYGKCCFIDDVTYNFTSVNHSYIILRTAEIVDITSNLKYSIKEWNSINCVPPLINCLENKKTFECQPSVNQVIEYLDFAI